jgi:hypothetical protein
MTLICLHGLHTRSNGDTSFEEAMLKRTPCEVVTLDCTLRSPLKLLDVRHK